MNIIFINLLTNILLLLYLSWIFLKDEWFMYTIMDCYVENTRWIYWDISGCDLGWGSNKLKRRYWSSTTSLRFSTWLVIIIIMCNLSHQKFHVVKKDKDHLIKYLHDKEIFKATLLNLLNSYPDFEFAGEIFFISISRHTC